jgi:hypothetical protein
VNNRVTTFVATLAVLASLVLVANPLIAQSQPPSAGQAGIRLTHCNAELCNANNTSWDLTKQTSAPGDGTVTLSGDAPDDPGITWTVNAVKGDTTATFLTVDGTVTVTNIGTADATIGNIAINLQKRVVNTSDWVSVAADVADATNGDGATTAKIVAAASTESAAVNASFGPPNYTVSGAQGTFVETAGSGSLSFTDAASNTVFGVFPQVSLAPGASITFLYSATFDNTVLGLAAGTQVRSEAMITFGNAGLLGGSGSIATNIDIDGNGVIDADEDNVRTVPCRVTRNVPDVENGNASVTLSDSASDVAVTGTNIGFSGFTTDVGADNTGSGEVIVSSRSALASGTASCTPAGSGTITNTAHLDGESFSVIVQGPQIDVDPITGLPIYQQFEFPCVIGVELDATANAAVVCDTAPPVTPDVCTHTQGGWGGPPNGNNPASLLANNFSSVYPGRSVEVGILGNSGYSMRFRSSSAVGAYLPAGGQAAALNADLVDPTKSSSGVFGGQVLALQLNTDFNHAGLTHDPSFASLILCNTGTSLDGSSVAQILAAANTALGGGALPAGYTAKTLNDLVTRLNESFDECSASTFAAANLCRP